MGVRSEVRRSNLFVLIVGLVLRMVIGAGSGVGTNAAGGALEALPASVDIRFDGVREDIQAYAIQGTTFVSLVDVGKAVDFNVYWDGNAKAVQVERDMPYTGKAPERSTLSAKQENIRQDIIAWTNAVRTQNGEAELEVNQHLMKAAQVRAEELAATSTYAHTRPDGRKFTTVTDCPYVGENIHRITTAYLNYYGLDVAQTAVESWAESSGHRKNILNPGVCAMGSGVAKGKNDKGEDAWYLVQMFLVKGCAITWVDGPVLSE